MIYSIVGTDIDVRGRALKALSVHGKVTNHLYQEHIESLESFLFAASLFGEPIVVHIIQALDTASSKDILVELLPRMKDSSTIFVIDEPFADVNKVKQLTKYSKEVFDARVEKEKGVDVFTLCNYIAKRDKKNAWIEFMRIKDKESGEAIQGLLWWKWKTLWASLLEGKKTAFSKEECETIGRTILFSTIKAHRGEGDVYMELEKVILAL